MTDAAPTRSRTFKKFTFRGIDLEALMDMSSEDVMDLMHSRVRRRFSRGIRKKPLALIKRLRKEKMKAEPGTKPDVVKTHLRDMIIVPEMIGGVVGVYNGKLFNSVEVKADMVGHYLAEFSITYKPSKHGRAGMVDKKVTVL